MEPKLPGKLYKYRRIDERTIQTIVNGVLYFSSPSGLNDPFDCRLRPMSYDGTDEEYKALFTRLIAEHPDFQSINAAEIAEQWIREGRHRNHKYMDDCFDKVQKQEHQQSGVLCLCADPSNILMWSHYADSHKGCCLEFSTKGTIFKSSRCVEYAKEYPGYRFLDLKEDGEAFSKLTVYTKSELWSYEKEWRVSTLNGPGLYKFHGEALTGIIFGYWMSPEHKDLLKTLVKKRNPIVKLYQSVPWKRKFMMEIEPLN